MGHYTFRETTKVFEQADQVIPRHYVSIKDIPAGILYMPELPVASSCADLLSLTSSLWEIYMISVSISPMEGEP